MIADGVKVVADGIEQRYFYFALIAREHGRTLEHIAGVNEQPVGCAFM